MYRQTEEYSKNKVRITVFTPAYNRGYIIEKLYRSLQRQSFTDFEWIVVDDGSSDDTQARFEQFLAEENPFPIRYIKTENGGKHRAINLGVQLAGGELFFIVDSDDHIVDDALEWIDKIEKTIPAGQKENFCGICGLKGDNSGKPIGTTYEGEILDITTLEREKYGLTGDKAEVFYTSVLQRYPFPTFEEEKFMTECVVWDRIAADGLRLRFYNRISIICNYLPDGLTSNHIRLIQRNPKGYALYLRQCRRYGKLSGVDKCNTYVGFCESLSEQYSFSEISDLLGMKPMRLRIMLLGMRIYRKIFDR